MDEAVEALVRAQGEVKRGPDFEKLRLERALAYMVEVKERWRREAERVKGINARLRKVLQARGLRTLAPWWKLGCEEIDASGLHFSNETPLDRVPFSFRVRNCLRNAGKPWATVGDLRQVSEAELFCMANFGKVSLAEVRRWIWMTKPGEG